MANKKLFSNSRQTRKIMPKADTVNEAGGIAYAMSNEHALAQLAATGCLNTTFYASGEDQLKAVLDLAQKVSPRYLAQTALYARERGYMKDMPALLLAVLAKRDQVLLKTIFNKIIDNGKMLRNFVQIIRSGETGQNSLNRTSRKLIADWLNDRDDFKLLEASIGNDPSLKDIIKLAHPHPNQRSREAYFGWLADKKPINELTPAEIDKGVKGYNPRYLPQIVKEYEAYKKGETKTVPNVPFLLLTALDLGKKEWTEIAKDMKWHATRMNLNTLKRHGVFEDKAMVRMIADRLADKEMVRKAKVFPYQLFVAYLFATDAPMEIREALQDAMEVAMENIPEVNGKVVVLPDISGSMTAPITGQKDTATTKVTCRDMAALISAAIVRKNPRNSEILPFSNVAHTDFRYNPRDSVMTIAQNIQKLPAGGTDCSAPMKELANRKEKVDLIIYVSDNMSWVDSVGYYGIGGRAPQTMEAYAELKKRNPNCKLVMVDGQPNTSTQVAERKDILNIGGFSDEVFEIISEFADGKLGADHWVGEIERISLK